MHSAGQTRKVVSIILGLDLQRQEQHRLEVVPSPDAMMQRRCQESYVVGSIAVEADPANVALAECESVLALLAVVVEEARLV